MVWVRHETTMVSNDAVRLIETSTSHLSLRTHDHSSKVPIRRHSSISLDMLRISLHQTSDAYKRNTKSDFDAFTSQ